MMARGTHSPVLRFSAAWSRQTGFLGCCSHSRVGLPVSRTPQPPRIPASTVVGSALTRHDASKVPWWSCDRFAFFTVGGRACLPVIHAASSGFLLRRRRSVLPRGPACKSCCPFDTHACGQPRPKQINEIMPDSLPSFSRSVATAGLQSWCKNALFWHEAACKTDDREMRNAFEKKLGS